MRRERSVERAQKEIAVEGVVLPGILAVERDEHHVTGARLQGARALGEFLDEVGRGIISAPRGVAETDKVGQLIVAEEAAQARIFEMVRAIEVAGVGAARRIAREPEARRPRGGAAGGAAR